MWEVTIKILNIVQKLAQVTARRTEEDVADYIYTCTAILDTPDQRTGVLDQIKDNYLEYLDRQVQSDGVVAGLEDTATNALNTWEATL